MGGLFWRRGFRYFSECGRGKISRFRWLLLGEGVQTWGGWEGRVVLGVARLGHLLECRVAKGDLGYWVLLFGGSDGLRE